MIRARHWLGRRRAACLLLLTGIALVLEAGPTVHAAGGSYVLDHTIHGVDDILPGNAWREPSGIAFGADGRIYVSDAFDGRLTELEPEGRARVLVPPRSHLVSPTHVAVDQARDRIYVSDVGAGALVVLDLEGDLLRRHEGIPGAAGVAIAPDGSVYVGAADTGLVHVFGSEGEELGSWRAAAPEDEGSSIGDLLRGIDVDADGWVYVVDGRRAWVLVFDATGTRHETLRPPEMAWDIAVDYAPEVSPRKRYWMATERGVYRYDPRTKVWDQAPSRPAPIAIDVALDHGSVVAIPATDRIIRNGISRVERRIYGELGGSPERSWQGPTLTPGTLNGPQGISAGPAGRLYLLDLDPRLQRMEADGQLIDQLMTNTIVDVAGAADGRFFVLLAGRLVAYEDDARQSWTIVVPAGAMALAYDAAADSLALLDDQGYLTRYDSMGGAMRFRQHLDADPTIQPAWIDLAADATGQLFALDRRGPAVTHVDASGRQQRFALPVRALRITATPTGDLLALGRDGWVRRFATDGQALGAFDATRFDIAVSSDPVDLAADATGRVFVADRKADLVSRFLWDEAATPKDAPESGAPCRHFPDKTAAPPLIYLGETVDVNLKVRGGCGSEVEQEPLDIVLIIDESGSMAGQKIRTAREAARDFVTEVDLALSQVGIVGFDTQSRRHQALTQDQRRINLALERLTARGGTRIDMGLALAREEMRMRGRPGIARPIFILLSDGFNNAGPDPVIREADAAKREGIEIYTIGILADAQLMQRVASGEDHYFAPQSARFLYEVFDAIALRITTATLFRQLTVIDEIPRNMRYVENSAIPPASFDAAANSLTWQLTDVAFKGFGLRYTLEPLEIGTWPTNVVAWGEGEDGFGRPTRVDFPIPQVIVIGPTPTPSPTPTDTPTPTVTPSPTPTPEPGPIYLPILLRERCTPQQLRADVVLVLDASSSMQGEKLAAAKRAATGFVEIVLGPSTHELGNQVAVVGFNSEAWLAAGLERDPSRLRSAIDGLEMRRGTRIDRGLVLAYEELKGPRRILEHTPTIVLLTDGLQNGAPDPVYAIAETARAEGSLIYTVGLGADVDVDFLSIVAGDPERRFLAPGPGDLAAIYDQIAGEIPCAADAFWGRRLASP